MKFFKTAFLLIALFHFALLSYSQKNCQYKIDTARILLNQNLDEFINKFQTDSFTITNNKKGIPSFIKKQLDCFTGEFSMANPNEPYQLGDVIYKKLPRRQLLFLAKNDSLLMIIYLTGSWGKERHMLFIKFKNKKIIDLWCGICLEHINSKQEILEYITQRKNTTEGLNTNCIYL